MGKYNLKQIIFLVIYIIKEYICEIKSNISLEVGFNLLHEGEKSKNGVCLLCYLTRRENTEPPNVTQKHRGIVKRIRQGRKTSGQV